MSKNENDNLVHNKEKMYFILSLIVSVAVYASMFFSLWAAIIIVFFGVLSYVFHALNMAHIRRNAVRISTKQFPDAYEKAVELAGRMGLTTVPSIYIQESNGILNAFASRFFRKDMVVIYSDIFDLIESNQEDELLFVLAHEFAHVKRRHVLLNMIILPAMWIPFLGEAYQRACEYTCDRYAAYYSNNMETAQNALTLLAVGKKLQHQVNQEAYLAQLEEERGFFLWLSEVVSSHPHLPKRMNALKHWEDPTQVELYKERKWYSVVAMAISFFVVAIFAGVFWLMSLFTADMTTLMEAAMEGDTETIQAELQNGADIDVMDEEGSSALHWALWFGENEAAQLLVEEGSDLNLCDYEGYSPLMIAVFNEDVEMAAFLLENGATPTLEDIYGMTAYDYAVEYENEELIQLLKQ